jgi:PKD domain
MYGVAALVGAALPAIALTAGAAAEWLPHEQRSNVGDNYIQSWPAAPDSVAINARGDGVMAWHRVAGFDAGTVQSAIHRAGAPPATTGVASVSPDDYDPSTNTGTRTGGAEPVTIDEAGNARVFYAAQGADGFRDLLMRRSPPGSFAWEPPVTITDANSAANEVLGGLNAATNASGETVLLAVEGGALTGYAGSPGAFGSRVVLGGNGATRVVMNDAGDAAAVRLVVGGGLFTYRVNALYRARGGSWTTAPSLLVSNFDAETPDVAIGGDGTAIAVWSQRGLGTNKQIHFAARPPGGPWGTPAPLSIDGIDSTAPSIAMNESGEAILAYQEGSGNVRLLRRPPGGTFASIGSGYVPETLTGSFTAPRVAFNDAGNALVSYNAVATAFPVPIIRAVQSAIGGGFISPTTISPFGSFNAVLAIGASGDAFAGYGTGNSPTQIRSAGFDGSAPRIEGFAFPTSAFKDVAFPYSVNVADAWSPTTVQWAFGDGQTATTAAGSKTYSANGSYNATVTATEPSGNTASAGGTVTVTDKPPDPTPTPTPTLTPVPTPTPPGASPTPGPGKVAVLAALALQPKAFFAAASGPSVAAKTPTGTTVSYTSTLPATTTFVVERVSRGYKKGRKCLARKPRGVSKVRRCNRYARLAGSFSHADRAGRNTFRFTGRFGGKTLKAAKYRLTAVARNVAGNSRPVRSNFTVRPKRRT